jgi:hypothetical protein
MNLKSIQSFVKELNNLSPLNIVDLMRKFNMCDRYPDPYACMVFTLLDAFNIICVLMCHVRHNVQDISLRTAHPSVFLSNIPTPRPQLNHHPLLLPGRLTSMRTRSLTR